MMQRKIYLGIIRASLKHFMGMKVAIYEHVLTSLVPDPSSMVAKNAKKGGGRVWANGLPFNVVARLECCRG